MSTVSERDMYAYRGISLTYILGITRIDFSILHVMVNSLFYFSFSQLQAIVQAGAFIRTTSVILIAKTDWT